MHVRAGACRLCGQQAAGAPLQRRCAAARAAARPPPREGAAPGGAPATRTLTLDTGGQLEAVQVQVASSDADIYMVKLAFPLGLVFEAPAADSRQAAVVAEVTPGGAADAAGVRPGDALRALSAAAMRMTYPTAQLMLGGVGRPKLMRALVAPSGFAAAMDAVRSNRQLGSGVVLFLERTGGGGGGGSGGGGSGGSSDRQAQAAVTAAEPGSIFDPSLFEK